MKGTTSKAPLWEQSKENAAPLERGRNVAVLERTLAANEEELKEKERMMRHYERLVVATDDPDPLVHWLSYIKFHQEAFPADTHSQFLLLERCFRAQCVNRTYANDPRFLRICCMYAEKTPSARDIFNYLYGQQIGVTVAIFWAAWAFVAEKDGDYKFAEKIFEKGIRKKALPLKYLFQRQKQFQRRMSRHWLNSTGAGDDDDGDDESVRPRGVLGGLSKEAILRNDRSIRQSVPNTATFTSRSSRTSRSSAVSSNSNIAGVSSSGFHIFTEDTTGRENGFPLGTSIVSHHDRVLEREQDRRKENTLATERWNERGALSSTSVYSVAATVRPQAHAAFAVYVDEECAAQIERKELERLQQASRHRRLRDDRTFRQRDDGGVAEKLSNDPLRYVRNPGQLQTDRQQQQGQDLDAHLRGSPKEQSKKGSSSRGFNSRLLKPAPNQEQCFEEARMAARFFTLVHPSTNVNHILQNVGVDDSYMSLDEGSMDIVSMDDTHHSQATYASMFSERSRVDPRNASAASSTIDGTTAVGIPTTREEQTINTQLALKELSMMFSSPAFALTDEANYHRRSGGLGPILNESGVSEAAASSSYNASLRIDGEGDSDTHGAFADILTDVDPSSSFAAVDIENDGPRNHQPRSRTTPGFEHMALRTLEDRPPEVRGSCASRRVLGTVAQEDPLRMLTETEFSADAGFQIFTNVENADARNRPPTRLSLHADNDASEGIQSGGNAFEIYQEVRVISSDQYQTGRDIEGDTATFSQLGDAFQILSERSPSSDTHDGSADSVNSSRDHFDASEVSKSLLSVSVSAGGLSDYCVSSYLQDQQ
jgi:checkpoint serine/threonine-protein kinase